MKTATTTVHKTFFVCGNTVYGTGHPIDNKIVVIEVEVQDGNNQARVLAPQAFAEKWSTVSVGGSMEAWVECAGPARLLTDKEWNDLLAELRAEYQYVEYSRKRWLVNARASGKTDEQIADMIAVVLSNSPLTRGLVEHFLASVPEEKLVRFAEQLRPS